MASGATKIVLRDMRFTAPLDVDSWGRPSKVTQPVQFTIAATVNMPSTVYGAGASSSSRTARPPSSASRPLSTSSSALRDFSAATTFLKDTSEPDASPFSSVYPERPHHAHKRSISGTGGSGGGGSGGGSGGSGGGASSADAVMVDYSELASMVLSVAGSPSASPFIAASSSAVVKQTAAPRALQFHSVLAKQIFLRWTNVTRVEMALTLPIGIHGAGASAVWASSLARSRSRIPYEGHEATLTLRDIRASALIGLREHEAGARQTVVTSLRFGLAKAMLAMEDWFEPGWAHEYVRDIVEEVERSRNRTVEGLIGDVAARVRRRIEGSRDEEQGRLRNRGDGKAKEEFLKLRWLQVVKTDALQFVDGSGVEMEFD